MERCKNCRHYSPEKTPKPHGSCSRWKTGYEMDWDNWKPDDAQVEDDEGWGVIVGPEFGCVLWEV